MLSKEVVLVKKMLSITAAFAVTLSLSACTMGNNRNNNINRAGYNNGRGDMTRISQQNTNTGYRDGIYTGYGAAHGSTNEVAIVEIRNGRIANVDLERIGLFRGDTDTPGGTQFNQGRAGEAAEAQDRTNNPGTTRVRTTPAGDDDFVGFGNTPPNTVRNDGASTGSGNENNNRTGLGTVVRNGNGTGLEGTTVLSTPANLDAPRRTLIRTILREQRYDVNVTDKDPSAASAINNWKLAVQNALAQAGR